MPSLWDCLRWWWACKTQTRGVWGNYLILPPGATNVRAIVKGPSQTGDPLDRYTAVVAKWDVPRGE